MKPPTLQEGSSRTPFAMALPLRVRRAALWALLLALVGIDAGVGHSLPLGPVYMLPVVYAALVLEWREVLATALVATVARALFGPVGDPLGLDQLVVELPKWLELPANTAIALVTFTMAGYLVSQNRRIRQLGEEADTDHLTGLDNRRALEKFLKVWQSRRGAVIAVDIDHFKQVNDTHGHAAGDLVLADLARRLAKEVRASDHCARVGGEEFTIVLPAVDDTGAREVAERIRANVERDPFDIGAQKLAITVSVGVAAGNIDAALAASADAALYAAKRGGRNRVALPPAMAELSRAT